MGVLLEVIYLDREAAEWKVRRGIPEEVSPSDSSIKSGCTPRWSCVAQALKSVFDYTLYLHSILIVIELFNWRR